LYVVSGFSRTVTGPPEGGHYVRMPLLNPWRRMIFNRLE